MTTGREEDDRVSTLQGYGVLDTPNEIQFDSIVRDAAKALGSPIALGSRLIGHSQKMTVAASATAEKKTVGQRS